MYPNLYYALKEGLGLEWEWTKIFNTFGLLMALAFVVAAIVISKEFKRKEKAGLLQPVNENYIAGEPANMMELLVQFIIGFLIGFKIIGGIIDGGLINDAQSYIASGKGNVFSGIALGALLVFFKWKEKDKNKLAKPEKRARVVWPHERVGDIIILGAVGGLIGAKIFHFFENWDAFLDDPWGNIISPAGLTFYGGLIVAAIVILWFTKNKNIPWKHLVDICAPALMIAYAVGRLGCQISGDGDWGVYNTAYISTPEGKVIQADSTNNYTTAMQNNPATANYLNRDIRLFGKLPEKKMVAPSFLPVWMVAMNYAHNVNEEADGVVIKGCEGKYCNMLPVPVFPTPFYETVMCAILFLILWSIRKKIKTPGVLFGIYLMMNGAERFLIEKLRVNTQYHFLGMNPSQAEIISAVLFLTGIYIIWYCNKKNKLNPAASTGT